MSHHLTVKVLDKNSKILMSARVGITIHGTFGGTELRDALTDTRGIAEFTTHNDYPAGQQISIVVRGQTVGTYSIDRGSYTVTAR